MVNLMTNFKRGDQIVYIPTHANGDKNHQDSEHGFVDRAGVSAIFCRYWSQAYGTLRTRANAEATDIKNLVLSPGFVPQEVVDAWLTILDWETRHIG